MILTGEPISGEKAYTYGLANKVVEEGELEEEAKRLAQKIVEKSKLTINQVMQLIPYAKTSQFIEGVAKEREAFGQIFGSDDAKEGVQAFIEKRKPNFQDK